MKHVFEGDITGESYDKVGHQFLGGMIADEWAAKLGERLARAEAVKRENQAMLGIIMALVKRAGGEVRLSDLELTEMMDPKCELLTHRDDAHAEVVFRYRLKL